MIYASRHLKPMYVITPNNTASNGDVTPKTIREIHTMKDIKKNIPILTSIACFRRMSSADPS